MSRWGFQFEKIAQRTYSLKPSIIRQHLGLFRQGKHAVAMLLLCCCHGNKPTSLFPWFPFVWTLFEPYYHQGSIPSHIPHISTQLDQSPLTFGMNGTKSTFGPRTIMSSPSSKEETGIRGTLRILVFTEQEQVKEVLVELARVISELQNSSVFLFMPWAIIQDSQPPRWSDGQWRWQWWTILTGRGTYVPCWGRWPCTLPREVAIYLAERGSYVPCW